MSPRLSVVLPTHNREDHLVRSARSVLEQDFRDLELVIVDDGSVDSTAEVVARLAAGDPRVRHLRNEQPRGPSTARNQGIALASGELVSFCDDDDEWLAGAASTTIEVLDREPATVVVSAWHEVHHDADGSRTVYRGPVTYSSADLLWRNFLAIPFGVVRREPVGQDLLFDPALPPSEDWDLWLRCSDAGTVRTLPVPLYRYRQHRGQRVTTERELHQIGRRAFVHKHAERMTSSCIRYHDAVVELLGSRGRAARSLLGGARRAPGDTAMAGLMLANDFVASRVGFHRADPGLPARSAAQLLARAARGRTTT